MIIGGLVFSLIVPCGVGISVLIVSGVFQRTHLALSLGAAFGVGLLSISLLLPILPMVGLPLTPGVGLSVVVVAAGAFFAGIMVRRPSLVPFTSVELRTLRGWTRVAWWMGAAGLAVRLAMVLDRAMSKPVLGWDAFIVHALRAKAMYYDQTISASTLQFIGNADYPLGFPLIELWVSWCAGGWDDTAFKLVFPCLLAALLAMMYGGLRHAFGPLGAMAGTWLVAGLPLLVQHATDAYLDLPLAYAALGAAIFLWRYATTRHASDVVLGSLMTAFAVWMKNEGVLVLGINLIALTVLAARERRWGDRASWMHIGLFALSPVAIWGAWSAFKMAGGITGTLTIEGSAALLHAGRLPDVLALMAFELVQSANWHVLWPVFFAGWMVYFRRSFDPSFLFFGWPVVLTLAAFVIVSASSVMYQYLFEGSTAHRMVLHVAPLAAFWVALVLGDLLRMTRREVAAGP